MGIAPRDRALGVVGVAPVGREGPGRGKHRTRWGGKGAVSIAPATGSWAWRASGLCACGTGGRRSVAGIGHRACWARGVVPVGWEGMWEAHLVVPNPRAREMERAR